MCDFICGGKKEWLKIYEEVNEPRDEFDANFNLKFIKRWVFNRPICLIKN